MKTALIVILVLIILAILIVGFIEYLINKQTI